MKKAYGADKAEIHYTVEVVTDTLGRGLNSHTNSFFLHSRKRPAPGTNTFFAARAGGCPLKRSSSVLLKRIHLQTDQEVTELQLTQITEVT